MAQYKRRKFFIDKQLQTKYMLATILLLVAYTVLFAVVLFVPYIIPLSSNVSLQEQEKAARILLTLHQSVWPALGVVIIALGIVSIFITHKIAGPVYRFKKVLSEVSNGDLNTSISLRKGDDLKDLADDLNSLLSELRGVVGTLKENHSTDTQCIDKLNELISTNQLDQEVGEELVQQLRNCQAKSAQVLDKYSD